MSKDKQDNEIDSKLIYDGVSVDWFLQHLSELTNASDLELGITLQVSGQTITGTMIGGKKYFKLFAESFSDAWPFEDKKERKEIREAFEANGKIYEGKGDDEPRRSTQYIHLADARIFEGGRQVPHSEGMLWRGKVNSVSGFSLGTLTES